MPCNVILDLRPAAERFVFSKSGKSATLPCVFSGKFKSENTIDIELVITGRSGFAAVKEQAEELEKGIAEGSLLRVIGVMQRIAYQDRDSGQEIDQLRVYALDVTFSAEKEPIFSVAQMEGGVRKLSDTEIFKDHGDYRKVAFSLFSNPSSDFDRETYLTVYCTGYGEVADKVERLKLKDKAHIIEQGKLEATAFGVLGLKLFDVNYAKIRKKETENDQNESKK